MNRQEALKRAKVLVDKMTLEEKASQLLYNSPAVDRLGIKGHNWWNEALHGVARADVATVFPQAIGLAATFDPELIKSVGDTVSTEGRIKHTVGADDDGNYGIYRGLTFWSPNINIFRDPRWGRGQETYGEDPYLTSRMGTEYVKGLQGDGEFLKSAACAKHFAVHSGPEKLRHTFDATCSKQDLWETYLPAFERVIKDSGVEGVMGAYNRVEGEVCCAHSMLMTEILYKQWQFGGYFVSDCGAVCDFHNTHKVTATGAESAALALNARCNINCGNAYANILKAVEQGLVTEDVVTENVVNAYATRFMLGEFEENDPFADIPFDLLDCDQHKAQNLEVARRSLVLLKNDGVLPLKKDEIKSIAVIGPNAYSIPSLVGNYNGASSEYVTICDGIRKALPDAKLYYSVGCHHLYDGMEGSDDCDNYFTAATAIAKRADAVVLCVGLNASIEGEEIPGLVGYSDGGDRTCMTLPEVQLELIRRVSAANDKVVLVLTAGSPVDIGEDLEQNVNAFIEAWYPGAQGGNAVADLIFGEYSPSGKLPLTFPKKDAQLPDICDYSMEGRTYRYAREDAAYPFGFGLSYSKFTYSDAKLNSFDQQEGANISFTVSCEGFDGIETAQVYAKFSSNGIRTPNFQLCGISSIPLAKGESKTVSLNVPAYWMKAVNEDGERIVPDTLSLFVGSHQPDARSCALSGTECIEIKIK